jgi:CheY-like chemotaxis protein
VQRQHGSLEILSAPGAGTTARVLLPTLGASRSPGGPRARDDAPAGTSPPGGSRVLIVEDETSVRETLVAILAELGHVALAAGDLPEALALLQGEGSRPPAMGRRRFDLVVVDLALPSGSGLEVARALKRTDADTPVVLVTAWPGHLNVTALKEHGVVAVVEKPVGMAELRAALAAALARDRSE